jgi:hypothetical protein
LVRPRFRYYYRAVAISMVVMILITFPHSKERD